MMAPYHKTLVFWLAGATTAYAGVAGAVAVLAPALLDSTPPWLMATLACIGVALPTLAILAKRMEAPHQWGAVFWLATVTAVYTAMAGAVATMAPELLSALPTPVKTGLAVVGLLLPAAAALAKRHEAPRKPVTQ